MYKVVIVDDEYWILQGIINTFDWEKYSFEICCSTNDPIEAYEMIKKEAPDVVFTDIKMPVMTGIELCERLAKENCKPLFVFISSYDDYEYMRKAIINNAFDYCLKPIDKADSDNILKRLKESLDEHRSMQATQGQSSHLQTKNIENRAFSKMIDYINKNYATTLRLNELSRSFHFNKNYCCTLFNKYMGMNFSDYVNKVRIEKALEMMKSDTTLSMEEISEKVGYISYSHFCKRFKKYVGVSVTEFKHGRLSEKHKPKEE